MVYRQRTLESFFPAASDQFPVVLVVGPRQVGKTTLLQHLSQKDRTYVTLDDPKLAELAREDPALFLQRYTPPVLIDEIQYAPELLPYLKIAVDREKKKGMFWLTGSQQFQLMQGVTESLAGRVGIINLMGLSQFEILAIASKHTPFLPLQYELSNRENAIKLAGDAANISEKTAAAEAAKAAAFAAETAIKPEEELGDTIKALLDSVANAKAYGQLPSLYLRGIYKRIWYGSFPGVVYENADRDLFFSSYVQTYLQRDVRTLANVWDETSFLKFLRAAAARTGQLLNMSDMARDADVSVPTAKRWLGILEASGIIYLLEPYYTNTTKRLIKAPKLFFLDTGLCAYLTEWSSPETLEAGAMSGAILETFVFNEILKSYWHNGKRAPLYYYRDKDKKEIDILIVQDDTFHPIEIKKTASPDKKDTRHFGLLEQLGKPVGEGAIICLAETLLPVTKNIHAIPVSMV